VSVTSCVCTVIALRQVEGSRRRRQRARQRARRSRGTATNTARAAQRRRQSGCAVSVTRRVPPDRGGVLCRACAFSACVDIAAQMMRYRRTPFIRRDIMSAMSAIAPHARQNIIAFIFAAAGSRPPSPRQLTPATPLRHARPYRAVCLILMLMFDTRPRLSTRTVPACHMTWRRVCQCRRRCPRADADAITFPPTACHAHENGTQTFAAIRLFMRLCAAARKMLSIIVARHAQTSDMLRHPPCSLSPPPCPPAAHPRHSSMPSRTYYVLPCLHAIFIACHATNRCRHYHARSASPHAAPSTSIHAVSGRHSRNETAAGRPEFYARDARRRQHLSGSRSRHARTNATLPSPHTTPSHSSLPRSPRRIIPSLRQSASPVARKLQVNEEPKNKNSSLISAFMERRSFIGRYRPAERHKQHHQTGCCCQQARATLNGCRQTAAHNLAGPRQNAAVYRHQRCH